MDMPEGWKILRCFYEAQKEKADKAQTLIDGRAFIERDAADLMKEMAEALEDAYHEQPGTRHPTKVELALNKFKEWK